MPATLIPDDDWREQAAREAADAIAVFRQMPTRELRRLATAHRIDAATAPSSAPDLVAFSAGRMALIGVVLRERAQAADPLGQTPDPAIVDAMHAELTALLPTPLVLTLRPTSAFQLAAVVQIALGHPHLGKNREAAELFVEGVRAYFTVADATTVLAVLARGDQHEDDDT